MHLYIRNARESNFLRTLDGFRTQFVLSLTKSSPLLIFQRFKMGDERMWATSRDSPEQSLSPPSLDQSTDPRCPKGGEHLTWFTRSIVLHRCRATIAAAVPEFSSFQIRHVDYQPSNGPCGNTCSNQDIRLWNGSRDLHAYCSLEVEDCYVVRIIESLIALKCSASYPQFRIKLQSRKHIA